MRSLTLQLIRGKRTAAKEYAALIKSSSPNDPLD